MIELEQIAAQISTKSENWLGRVDLPLERRTELHRAEKRRERGLKDAIDLKGDISVSVEWVLDCGRFRTIHPFPREGFSG